MEQSIEQRSDGRGVAEELAPVLAGAIRGDQRRSPFVAPHDDLQEILGRGVGQPFHPEIVDHQERDRGDLREVILPRAGELSVGELVDEAVGLAIEDAMPLLDDGEADGLGEMAFARAGRNNNILRSFRAPSSFTTAGTRSVAAR